jgi:hypothetical protein
VKQAAYLDPVRRIQTNQEGGKTMVKWEYKNLQLKTVPTFGVWSRISENDLDRLGRLQNDGWEVFQVVNIRGSVGFTSYVLFMLRREL